jgi:DNA mismatch repair protein MutL
MPYLAREKKKSRVMLLPSELANQIAAGEVVERPMSVVKELVENSIDAEAVRILIEVEAGGKTLIRVTDNGRGMPQEDAVMAFSRHATSKITQPTDLEAITSLGFRGEALPSIASVAKVCMTTTDDESRGGRQVLVEGGGDPQVKEVACSRGTVVEVAQLFFNLPARKKFLKADSTESSHITQVVTQQALAHPNIHFTLISNGRKIIDTPPTDQALYRIAELFGSELAKELVQVDTEAGDYHLTGFISSPVYTRPSRSAQYCYINRRFVRDKVISHSTQHGYSHLLPKGQHPAIYLFLSMNPKLYDVGVKNYRWSSPRTQVWGNTILHTPRREETLTIDRMRKLMWNVRQAGCPVCRRLCMEFRRMPVGWRCQRRWSFSGKNPLPSLTSFIPNLNH